MKTLKEVETIVGLKRRAIQEYENAGLAIKPITKNMYGHLLYDVPDIEKLWQLRFYKELGYDIPRIKNIYANGTYNEEDELERVIQELKERREQIDNLISIAQAMKETGISFNTFKKTIVGEDINAKEVFAVLGTSLNLFNSIGEEKYNMEVLSVCDFDNIIAATDRIMDLYEMGKCYACEDVQGEVTYIHNIIAKALSKSIIFFEGSLMCLEPGSKMAEDMEEIYDKEKMDFLRSALRHYCQLNANNKTDREIIEAVDNIGILGRKKYTTYSPEVQAEVKRIHNFLLKINLYKDEQKLETLKKIGVMFGSNAYKQIIDNGAQKGVSWFTSRAIEIYCENVEQTEKTN